MMRQLPAQRCRLRHAFDRAASEYGQVAALPQEIARRMSERLALVRVPIRSIVDIGSGTGFGGELLRRRYARASFLALDLSEGMLRQARPRAPLPFGWLSRRSRCYRVCADFQHLPLATASFDLAWSNLALHWSPDLPSALQEVHRVLRPGGLLTFSMFGPDTLSELRAAATEAEFRVNEQIDMHDIGDMLVRAGFADPVMDMELLTLTYADVPALLSDLRAHGSCALRSAVRPGLAGRQRLERVVERYARSRRDDGRLPATFEVIYGHAWKAPERVSPTGKPVIEISPG